MHCDCHIHMALDGSDWKAALARHKTAPDEAFIRATLKNYQALGFDFLRDGGDRWGAGEFAAKIAGEYGICYRTPCFPIYKRGHYGSFIGRGYETLDEFRALVREVKERGGHFIKIMISGLMDFNHYGILTDTPMPADEVAAITDIAHEAGFAAFACVYPMWYILANSLAAPEIANRGPVAWWPKALSLDAYKVVFQNEYILSGFKITILRTVVATFTHVFFTSMVAYGMSRQDLIGKKLYMKIAMITMFFNGGLIPNFILMIKLKLYNTFWVYILPGMFTFYNMVIFMSFFRSIPESLMESARLDGASEFTVYWKIVMPNAKPVIATIGLFTAVYHWNDYYQGVVYIRDKTLEPLQTILYKLLAETSMTAQQQQAMLALGGTTTSATVKYAAMFVGALPILCLYPFIQKYLVKGVMLGAIKG